MFPGRPPRLPRRYATALMPVLADTKQADHLVDGDVPLFELAGRVGPDELLDRHTYSALNFALEVGGLLLRSEIYHRRTRICIRDQHDHRVLRAGEKKARSRRAVKLKLPLAPR